MLAPWQGDGDGVGQEDRILAAASREWQPLSRSVAALGPRDSGEHQSMVLWSPRHFARSLRRAGGPAYVTTGHSRQEGDTVLPVRWESPDTEIFQPGAISYIFTEEWR